MSQEPSSVKRRRQISTAVRVQIEPLETRRLLSGTTWPANPLPTGVPIADGAVVVADAREPNDWSANATPLRGASGALSFDRGQARNTDSDWYRVAVGAGVLTVRLSAPVSQGELNVEVYDDAGRRLGGAYRSENVSVVSVDVKRAGEVRILVYAKGGYRGNPYGLAWSGAGGSPSDPGAGAADTYENNDAPSSAFTLGGASGSLSGTGGRATATDNDWYRVFAGSGAFTAQLGTDPSRGDVNLEVYDTSGRKLGGAYEVEALSTLRLDLPRAQELRLFVYARGGFHGNLYDLSWAAGGTVTPPTTPPPTPTPAPNPGDPGAGPRDAYEANDTRSTARRLAGASGSLSAAAGRATATNVDWYRLDLGAGTARVQLDAVASDGELNVELYDARGRKLAGGYQSENRTVVEATRDTAGPLYVQVYGAEGNRGNFYDLTWSLRSATPGSTPAPAPPTPTAPQGGGVVGVSPRGGSAPVDAGAYAGQTVVINLLGVGGVVPEGQRDGDWWVNDASEAQRTRRGYDIYPTSSPDVTVLQTADFFNRGFVKPELGGNDRGPIVNTYWTGTENPQGQLELHTQRNLIALGEWVRSHLGADRVVLKGTSSGGGGAILAALAAPTVFDAVIALEPYTIANRARDVPQDYPTRDRLGNTLFRGAITESTRTDDGRRVLDFFNTAARVRDAGQAFPPLLMVSGLNDTSMIWANDQQLISALQDTGRTFAAFWNQGNHSDAHRRVAGFDGLELAFTRGDYSVLSTLPSSGNTQGPSGVVRNVRAADR